MKKRILALALAVITAVSLCACSTDYAATIGTDGKVAATVTLVAPKATMGDPASVPSFKTAKIENVTDGGVACYKITQTKNFANVNELKKSLVGSDEYDDSAAVASGSMNVDLFNIGAFGFLEMSNNYMLGRIDPMVKQATASISMSLSITFPYEIKATNQTKAADGKTIKIDFSKANDVYVATSATTAKFATAADISKAATEYIDSKVTPGAFKVSAVALKSDNKIKLSWTKSANADTYTIYEKVNSGKYKESDMIWDSTSATIYCCAGKKYKFKIVASNTATTKTKTAYSSSVTTLKKNTVKATAKNKAVKLTWKKDTKASGYKIYMKKSGSKTYKLVKTVKGNKTTSYTKKSLKSGKKYTFKIRSYKTVSKKSVYGSYSKSITKKVK